MNRKNLYITVLFIVLMFFGCTSVQDRNEDSVNTDSQTEMQMDIENAQGDTKPYDTALEETNVDNIDLSADEDVTSENGVYVYESFENVPELYEGGVKEYIDIITDDMLDACREYPSYEAYWNDPIVLLYEYNDNLRLYGITATESRAMLLYVQGEKVFVHLGFQNQYAEPPKLNYSDIDSDGVEEVIISDIVVSGNIRRYELIVCDYENIWNVYSYGDYVQDIEETIQWQYDEARNTIIFMDQEGNVLTEQVLPEWTASCPFAGVVDYEDWMSFDAETMQFAVTPGIILENPMPYSPIEIVFNVIYKDGEFDLGDYYIQDTYWNQYPGN